MNFSGPHPADLPGTQIHYLARASERTDIWHIAYQDVIAIGELWASGRLSPERVVALGGAALGSPQMTLPIPTLTDEDIAELAEALSER